RLGMALTRGSSIERIEAEFLGRIAEHDTRLLATSVLLGVLRGHTEEEVNVVNAPALAEERGIEVVEAKRTSARDYTDLVRVVVSSGEDSVRVVGTTIGRRARPHHSRPGASASTSSSSRTSRCSATATCPAWSAGSGRRSASTASTSC